MANEKKKIAPPPVYNDPGWGDSISVSRKAREELAENQGPTEEKQTNSPVEKKTVISKGYSKYSPPTKRTAKLVAPQSNKNESREEMTSQVDQMNSEITKAVSEIEGVLERFLVQFINAVQNFFLSFYHLILKIVLIVFIEPLKNAGKFSAMFLNMVNDSLEDFNRWVSGEKPIQRPAQINMKKAPQSNPSKETPPQQQMNVQSKQDSDFDNKLEIERKYPHVFDGIIFGELSKKGIIFLNIKNNRMYDQTQRGFTVEEEHNLLETAIKEINNCARLAKSLPSPTKGRYVNMNMEDILSNAGMDDLKAFLQYVYTHPKPFIERQLRLSEAFATWAHKGAPV